MTDVYSQDAFRLVNFKEIAIPVHRIVSIEADSSGRATVRWVDGDNDQEYQTLNTMSYGEAIRAYKDALNPLL